jgi:RNA polymerase-binding transcription factor DksA
MEALFSKLYEELRISGEELRDRLDNQKCTVQIRQLMKEEIKDIETALNKIKKGIYGKCEMTGQTIPEEILTAMPTIQTMKDIGNLHHYFRKPLY